MQISGHIALPKKGGAAIHPDDKETIRAIVWKEIRGALGGKGGLAMTREDEQKFRLMIREEIRAAIRDEAHVNDIKFDMAYIASLKDRRQRRAALDEYNRRSVAAKGAKP